MTPPLYYRPSAYYYRQAIRDARSRKTAAGIALALVLELERHKAWIREQGLIPPKWLVTPAEREAKAWVVAGPSPSRERCAATEV